MARARVGAKSIANLFVRAGLSLTLLSGSASAECDLERGKQVVEKCTACHSLEPDLHMVGPSLRGILGRRAGSAPGFPYSLALERANLVWTAETLDAFLENPTEYIQGIAMPFGGLRRAEDRAALICWLERRN